MVTHPNTTGLLPCLVRQADQWVAIRLDIPIDAVNIYRVNYYLAPQNVSAPQIAITDIFDNIENDRSPRNWDMLLTFLIFLRHDLPQHLTRTWLAQSHGTVQGRTPLALKPRNNS
jgi:hypothetical protein